MIFLMTFLNDRFPFHNPSLLAKWTSVIGRDNWNPTKQSHLCSDHFTPRDYTSPDSGDLKETAVPSKFKRLPSSRIRKTEQHSGGKEIIDQGMLHGNLHWHCQDLWSIGTEFKCLRLCVKNGFLFVHCNVHK